MNNLDEFWRRERRDERYLALEFWIGLVVITGLFLVVLLCKFFGRG